MSSSADPADGSRRADRMATGMGDSDRRRPDDLLHGRRAGGRIEADSRMDAHAAEHGLDRRAWGMWAGRRRGRFASGSAPLHPSKHPRTRCRRGFRRHLRRPSAVRTLVVQEATPWFRLRDGPLRPVHRRVGGARRPAFARVGPPEHRGVVQALRTDAVGRIVSAATTLDVRRASELPKPAAGANAVRIVRNATNPPQAPLAVTAPVRYRQAPSPGCSTVAEVTA